MGKNAVLISNDLFQRLSIILNIFHLKALTPTDNTIPIQKRKFSNNRNHYKFKHIGDLQFDKTLYANLITLTEELTFHNQTKTDKDNTTYNYILFMLENSDFSGDITTYEYEDENIFKLLESYLSIVDYNKRNNFELLRILFNRDNLTITFYKDKNKKFKEKGIYRSLYISNKDIKDFKPNDILFKYIENGESEVSELIIIYDGKSYKFINKNTFECLAESNDFNELLAIVLSSPRINRLLKQASYLDTKQQIKVQRFFPQIIDQASFKRYFQKLKSFSIYDEIIKKRIDYNSTLNIIIPYIPDCDFIEEENVRKQKKLKRLRA